MVKTETKGIHDAYLPIFSIFKTPSVNGELDRQSLNIHTVLLESKYPRLREFNYVDCSVKRKSSIMQSKARIHVEEDINSSN